MFQHRTQNELCMWNSKVQRVRFGQPLRFAVSHLSTACVRGIFHSATLLDLGIFLKQLALRLSRCHASEQIYLVLYMAELVEAALSTNFSRVIFELLYSGSDLTDQFNQLIFYKTALYYKLKKKKKQDIHVT